MPVHGIDDIVGGQFSTIVEQHSQQSEDEALHARRPALTKIIATIGPASDDPATIVRLREMGHETALFAASVHPDLRGRARDFREHDQAPTADLLVYQASTGSPVRASRRFRR